jgi:hypothetical protein
MPAIRICTNNVRVDRVGCIAGESPGWLVFEKPMNCLRLCVVLIATYSGEYMQETLGPKQGQMTVCADTVEQLPPAVSSLSRCAARPVQTKTLSSVSKSNQGKPGVNSIELRR